ncbi:alpha-2-macroglobulin family protein [Campylobacter gastrosuis]|uniref:Alpha-2-macroglobulin n=1 Tax=Campylobacter gastrosuis TaxID=2974576 RepID=A0ABT7HMQ2_9BACT|nr:alpha-2-macroglobulin family protein [Campylobacter gastrosuis]MDL0088196.1 alpha-2-macroglobulin [Campylobacter gastrosuis]
MKKLLFLALLALNLNAVEIDKISKVDNANFIIGFSDELNASFVDTNLKIKGINFKTEPLKNGDFLLNFDKNSSNPLFVIGDFKLKYKENFNNKKAVFDEKAYQKAKTITLNSPEFKALDDGVLAFRLYLPSYLNDDLKQFVKISNINRFSISNVNYEYDKTSEIYRSYVDISSDEFKPNSEYEIAILKGFGDSYNVVREPLNFRVKTGDYAPFVAFIDDKPYLSNVGEIGIKSTNLNKVEIFVDKLSEQNYRYFLNLDNESLQTLVTRVAQKSYDVGGVKNEIKEQGIRLNLGTNNDGVYLITASFNDKNVTKAVYLSDIAINAKVARDEIFIFANRLSQNVMLGGANVKIYNDKNELIANGATNDEGVFNFSQKGLYKSVKSVVVSLANEQNFLILNEDERLNEDAFYENGSKNPSTFIYFASALIRPNEPIKGVIYLRDDEFLAVKNMPVKLVFKDPRGKILSQINKNTDDLGILDFNVDLNSDLSGAFLLEVVFESRVIKSEKFQVESFVPARLKNDISLKKTSFTLDESIKAKLSSSYLFGVPASGFNADVELMLFDNEYKDERYKGYKFINETIPNLNINSSLESIVLDENGTAMMSYDLDIKNEIKSVIKGVIRLDINDDGKMVSGSKSFEILPFDTLVGVRASSDFIAPNDEIKISSVVLNAKSKAPQNTLLKFEIKQLKWDYLREFSHSNYELKWFKSYEKIDEFYKKDEPFSYKFSKSGEYVIIATDIKSGASASFGVSVSGFDSSTLSPLKEQSRINIKLNANAYQKGDEISADISSMIKEGLGLITLEANGVRAYKLVQIKNYSANVKFKLDFDFFGGYIGANIYQNATFSPARAYSKIYVNPKFEARKINVELINSKTAKSNESFKIDIKTEPNADISLFVVDIGVLNIINQKSPNPLAIFNKKLNDGVFDYDIYSKLTGIKKYSSVLNFGGDMLMAMILKHESPVDDKNALNFINQIRLKADNNGTATFMLKIPNAFNSALRIDAIASNERGFGVASSEVAVKDDVVIKPTKLLYLLKDDEVKTKLRLINTTQNDKNVSLEISSSELIKTDLADLNISLKPFENRLLDLKILAKNSGKAELKIVAKTDDYSYLNALNFDILSPYPKSTYAKSITLKSPLNIKLPNGYESVKIDASNSPKSLLDSALNELISYPYGCVEQRSSRLFAMLYLNPQNKDEIADKERFLGLGVDEISKMQKQNGTFGYWDEFSNVNEFASIYATHLLLTLNDNGYKISNVVKNRALNALKNTNYESQLNELYALYLLSLYNRAEPSLINSIYERKIYENSLLKSYLMASSLKISGLDEEVKAVLKSAKNIKNESYDSRDFGSALRDMAFVLFLHAKHFKKDSFSDELASQIIKSVNSVNSTQERAFMIMAISEYFKNTSQNAEFKIQNGTEILTTKNFTPKNGEFKIIPSGEIFINISSIANAPLKIKHQKEPKPLDIYRSFVDKNGKEISINALKNGDLIYSKISLSAKNHIEVGVINEMISPCFEAVNEDIVGLKRTEAVKNSVNLSYKTIKDDRVLSFFDLEQSGEIFTPYRVVLSGKCVLPAVIAQNMYNEAQSDYDLEAQSFVVK